MVRFGVLMLLFLFTLLGKTEPGNADETPQEQLYQIVFFDSSSQKDSPRAETPARPPLEFKISFSTRAKKNPLTHELKDTQGRTIGHFGPPDETGSHAYLLSRILEGERAPKTVALKRKRTYRLADGSESRIYEVNLRGRIFQLAEMLSSPGSPEPTPGHFPPPPQGPFLKNSAGSFLRRPNHTTSWYSGPGFSKPETGAIRKAITIWNRQLSEAGLSELAYKYAGSATRQSLLTRSDLNLILRSKIPLLGAHASNAAFESGQIFRSFVRIDGAATAFQGDLRRLTGLLVHEMGHTLGLGHNFLGSVVKVNQNTPNSVMDYLPLQIERDTSRLGQSFTSDIKHLQALYRGTRELDPWCDEAQLDQIPQCKVNDWGPVGP